MNRRKQEPETHRLLGYSATDAATVIRRNPGYTLKPGRDDDEVARK